MPVVSVLPNGSLRLIARSVSVCRVLCGLSVMEQPVAHILVGTRTPAALSTSPRAPDTALHPHSCDALSQEAMEPEFHVCPNAAFTAVTVPCLTPSESHLMLAGTLFLTSLRSSNVVIESIPSGA